MNLGLRTLHGRLRKSGDPAVEWRRITSAAERRCDSDGRLGSGFARISAALGLRGTEFEWIRDLRQLGVIRIDGTWDPERARSVEIALELVGDSFETLGPAVSWVPVATLPREVARALRLPALRQTAGVLLELIDGAVQEVLLAAPYVDAAGLDVLQAALSVALTRRVDVTVVTSTGRGEVFASLAGVVGCRDMGALRVTEVHTDVSSLGSHAKLVVVDRSRAYVGSANFTAAGFARNVEVGIQVEGAQVDEVARLLDALAGFETPVAVAGTMS